MIPPREQWCIQIDVTNACVAECSNCTHLIGHSPNFHMSPQVFYEAVEALKNFPTASPKAESSPHKLIGIIGGEPLLHPEFERLASIMAEVIPDKRHRGLWTGLRWQSTKYAEIISEVFDEQFIHNNQHKAPCLHSPVLVAIQDVISNENERRALVSNCWLQQRWSSSITPKGFFHCEVAASLDRIFNGPGGLPLTQDCWDKDLSSFQHLIDTLCLRCGIPLNLKGRVDMEEIDDISHSNLEILKSLGLSNKVSEGRYVVHHSIPKQTTREPWRYKS